MSEYTRERAALIWPLMKAYAEGATLEIRYEDSKGEVHWLASEHPTFELVTTRMRIREGTVKVKKPDWLDTLDGS